RIEETYGEDPYLAARMGVAAVRGFQGGGTTVGPSHVIATLKHMTGHGQPESGTNVGPAPYGERTLRDFFLPPFEAAITEAHAKSVMPSYNEVDGVPSHANRWLLHDVLRGEWGFDGVIVSDWFAIAQLADLHHVAADRADAARRAPAASARSAATWCRSASCAMANQSDTITPSNPHSPRSTSCSSQRLAWDGTPSTSLYDGMTLLAWEIGRASCR